MVSDGSRRLLDELSPMVFSRFERVAKGLGAIRHRFRGEMSIVPPGGIGRGPALRPPRHAHQQGGAAKAGGTAQEARRLAGGGAPLRGRRSDSPAWRRQLHRPFARGPKVPSERPLLGQLARRRAILLAFSAHGLFPKGVRLTDHVLYSQLELRHAAHGARKSPALSYQAPKGPMNSRDPAMDRNTTWIQSLGSSTSESAMTAVSDFT